MHAVLFEQKRAHHAALAWSRAALRAHGLTPARHDMLVALHYARRDSQRALRELLGVSAPVVSRMVRALEALGLVRRVPHGWDRRKRPVLLTRAGTELMRRVHRGAFSKERVCTMFLGALLHVTHVGALYWQSRFLRGFLEDRAKLNLPWDLRLPAPRELAPE